MRSLFWPLLILFAAALVLISRAPVYGQNLPLSSNALSDVSEPDNVFRPVAHTRLPDDEDSLLRPVGHSPLTFLPSFSTPSEDCTPESSKPETPASALPCPAICEGPWRSLETFVSYDSYRGISDGGWQNNGIMVGANFGSRLGIISDYTGIGYQVGGQVGVFDWGGTDYRLTDQGEVTTQAFITHGLFRRATENSPWSLGVVHDWMFTNNYGVFAQNPTLSQYRAQIGYLVNSQNEIGVWGTWRDWSDSRNIQFFGETTWHAVNQLNLFYHHKWQIGADTWMWAGIPEHDRLAAEGGSLGDYLAGSLFNVPLSDRVALYGLITYMHQSASIGPAGATGQAWNFTIGMSWFPGRNAFSNSAAGQRWSPLMPVANNGYFLVDTNNWY